MIKFLINLYDDDANQGAGTEDRISFRQNEKISSKPVNLIQYFMNLISDQTALFNPEYQKFLKNICKYRDKGMNLNQENIYKLFKKHSAIREQIRFD